MRNTILTAAALLAFATPAAAVLPPPDRTATTTRVSYMTASFTAPQSGTYLLDSTYFTLGADSWGRVRATQTTVAGSTVTLRASCIASRGLYGWRVVAPDGTTGPATWVKCQ